MILLHNGTQYPYLFYEGEITCISPIIANITRTEDTTTYYIKNNADYTITNVFFIYIRYGLFSSIGDNWFEYVHFGDLNAGDEITITNSSSENLVNVTESKNIIRNALILEGLTLSESNELLSYWESYWFSPSNNGEYTRVLFQIPQLTYDELIPLSITPQPEVIKRVGLFTITDIPIVIS
ncbi:MAG: hypothetical protein QCI00_08515 [Candidatus Thermoplasmatota archaeon]|nr:hypothetical protein [Candidatus Thermoplasmatota archaeon]